MNEFKTKVMILITFLLSFLCIKNVYATTSDSFKRSFIGKYSYSMTNGKYGNFEHFTRNSDGEIAYCIEPGTSFSTENLVGYDGLSTSEKASKVGLSNSQLEQISLLSHFGYGYTGHSGDDWIVATQTAIWDELGLDYSFTSSWDNPSSKIGTPSAIKNKIDELKELVANYKNKPTFQTASADVSLGNSFDFIDSSNNLDGYEVESCTNCSASINGNTLTVTATSIGTGTITLTKRSNVWRSEFIVYYSSSAQNLIVPGFIDPIKVTLSIDSKAGKIAIKKTDSKTHSCTPTSPDATLKGAVYGVYKENGTFVYNLTIGSNCTVESPRDLPLGRYYILEKTAPTGYKKDTQKHYFTIDSGNVSGVVNINVSDDIYETNLVINKTFLIENEVYAEVGATFDIIQKSTNKKVATITIDESATGHAIIPYGVYILRQVSGKEGYQFVEDREIIVDENSQENTYVTLLNQPITARLKVVKVDMDSHKTITMRNIKFKIFDVTNNKYVCQTISYPNATTLCEFQTDENGILYIPYPLSAGIYRLEELDQVIDGYLWNNKSKEFTIDDNSDLYFDKDLEYIIEVPFENKQVKGEVNVKKYGEQVVFENDSYKYEEVELDDVTYNLYAHEDIYSQDGTLMYNKDDLIGTYVTKDGTFKIQDLFLGSYCLVEVATKDNYVLDSTKHCFQLIYKDQYTPVVSLDFTFKNYLKKGTMEFTKTDVSTGEPLPNTKIQIYSYTDDIEDAILIFEGYTDSYGKIILENLFVGKFYLVESDAPEGYVLNPERMLFEIKEDGEIVKSSMTNEKIKSKVQLHKVDENNNPLSGVTIGVFDLDGNFLGSYVTDENGDIEVELEYGSYYFQEIATIEGYVLSDEKVYFDVTTDGEIIQKTLVNELEEIEVPNTLSNSYINILAAFIVLIGGTIIIISNKKKK